jgi:glucokinase
MNTVGVDLGGTFTRVAVNGTLVARLRTDPDYDRQLAALVTAIPGNPAALGEDAPLAGAVALLTAPEAHILH